MKILTSEGILAANKVLSALKKLPPIKGVFEIDASMFLNGREQGYCFTFYAYFKRGNDLHFFVSNCRGSDQIQLCVGRKENALPYEPMYSDEAYKERIIFGCRNADECADFIHKNAVAAFAK